MTIPDVGDVVRDRKWGGRYMGTVTKTEDRMVFVAWHNSLVEDQLNAVDVEIVPDATDDLRAWRGGIGRLGGVTLEDAYRVIPVTN